MLLVAASAASVLLLAFANGANDNFKGAATVYGSRMLSYRDSLILATASTAAGGLASVWLSAALLKLFSGKGLVPDELLSQPFFFVAVASGAALTVLLATQMGMPTSTTHALTGGLIGAAVAGGVLPEFSVLAGSFLLPLFFGPFLAAPLGAFLYRLSRFTAAAFGIKKELCLCVGEGEPRAVRVQPDGQLVLASTGARILAGEKGACLARYQGRVWMFEGQTLARVVHLVSASLVCFARGINDTPKIAALMWAGAVMGISGASLLTVALMTAGSLAAWRVAHTMSQRITELNGGAGLSANLATSLLVLFASPLGLPVSTTHVSCGAIFGVGLSSGEVQWRTVSQIGATWLFTLPMGALLSGGLSYLLAGGGF